MDPNKKSLTSKSNNSPWLLCPSKSFPGKFYYFNGSTGETAWSLSDSDPNHPKKDIHRVEDNSHVFPEPFGPPDDSTNTSSSSLKKDFPIPTFQNATSFTNRLNFGNLPNTNKGAKLNQANFSNRSFTFGSNFNGARTFGNFKSPHYPMPAPTWEQAVLPPYLEDRLVPPKVVWTLTPMLLNEPQYQMFEPMQYDSPDMFINNPATTFRTLNRQGNPFFKNTSAAKGVQAGSPIFPAKNRHEKDIQTEQEPQTREEACQTFGSEVDVPIEPHKPKPVLKPSKIGAKVTSTSIGISTSPIKEVENEGKSDKTNKSLGDNDLRLVLEAKRRKSVDYSEAQKSIKDIQKENTPKKRVSFNLKEIEEFEVMPENERDPDLDDCSPLEPKQNILYVVPDSKILMTNYDYIEKIVLSADNCGLLVPFAVKAAVEAAGRDESWSTHGTVSARYILRKLKAPNVIIQRKPEKCMSSEEDSILDCCWQFSQDSWSLTLLTSNKELVRKAENIGISCSLFDPVTQQIVSIINDNKETDNKSRETVELENPLEVDLDISKLDINDECRNQATTQSNIYKKHDKEVKTCIVNIKNDIKVSGITKLNSVFDIDEELDRYYVKNEVMEQRLTSRRDEWVSRLILTMEGTLFDVLLKENVKKNMPPKDLQELIIRIGDTFKKHVKIRTVVDNLLTHLQRNVTKISKITPVDYIKLLGLCMILVQNLKDILDYTELDDADDLLSELIKHIEDPSTDIELSLDKLSPPRSDIAYENKIPLGYRKKQSNVLEYLKTHFPESFPSNEDAVKIVRTMGKDLNAVKVYSTKDIVDSTNSKTEPEIVKKFKVIEAFEEKLKGHKDSLDYEESLTSLLSDHTRIINDNFENENTAINNKFNSSEDVTDDLSSELEKECIYAYPLLKAFLAEIRATFIMIYNLLSNTMQETHGSENDRSELDFKINMAYNYIIEIAEKLKSIIDRESGSGPTLKILLIRAGEYVEEDRTMSQYKELITKYLKQAKILETALELILTIRSDCPQESSNLHSSCMS